MSEPHSTNKQPDYAVADVAIPVEQLKAGFAEQGLPDGIALVKRLLNHLDNGTTDLADAVMYERLDSFVDESQFNKERDWFLNDCLHPLAMSCDLPSPNTFLTTEVMAVPLLLTRDKHGDAHAFINACLHRGAAVKLEPSGESGRMSCPYHGWSYDMDGALVGISAQQHFGDCDIKRGDKLVELPLVEEAGILHVGLTPETPKVFEAQKGLTDVLAPLAFEKWHLFDRRAWWDVDLNWKLAVGTFLETYHIPFLHPETVTPYLNGGVIAHDNWGACSRMSIPARTIDYLRTIPELEWNPADHLTVMFHHYPSTTITLQGYMISVVQMFPGATPGTSRVQHSIYTPHKIDQADEAAFRTGFKDMLNFVLDDEDFMINATVTQSANVNAPKRVIFGRNEINLQTFQKGIAAEMAKRR